MALTRIQTKQPFRSSLDLHSNKNVMPDANHSAAATTMLRLAKSRGRLRRIEPGSEDRETNALTSALDKRARIDRLRVGVYVGVCSKFFPGKPRNLDAATLEILICALAIGLR
jgi:hypothetical protein